jgi:hypothetical protein
MKFFATNRAKHANWHKIFLFVKIRVIRGKLDCLCLLSLLYLSPRIAQ